jgi:Di-haem oxidoreductase, putative peroxidase
LGSYLHDGRAKILDESAMWPGGRRTESDRRFQALTEVERLQVQAFLKSRVAPASANSHEVSLAVEEGARGAAGASATPATGGQPREGVQPVRRIGCF